MLAIDNIAQKYMELSLWQNYLDSTAVCDVKGMVVNGDLLGYVTEYAHTSYEASKFDFVVVGV